ncbi:MAG: type II toxin-antitoxin system Phd/YefM family antitoxin [Terracidiphilus sp.]
MAITTLSSREFNQDTGRAKRAARKGPVFITDRGKPAHVLLSIREYQKITKKGESILDMLAMPGAGDIDFEPPRLGDELIRPADFS